MTKDEALKLALQALEANQPINYCMNNNGEKFPMMQEDPFRFERNIKAITAIREALAQPEQIVPSANSNTHQPEQEPFGYFRYDLRLDAWVQNRAGITGTPFYTTPPQRTWVGLTAMDIEEIGKPYQEKDRSIRAWGLFACAVEEKLKEKNNG